MDRTRTMPRLCWLVTAALTLVGAALRSVCMLTAFDTAVGYFNEGLLPTLSNILYWIAAAAAIIGAALIPKGALPKEPQIPRLPAALLLGSALIAFTVASFAFCYGSRTHDAVLLPILLGLPSALYFFASAKKDGRFSDGLSLLGFVPVLWCVTAVWETYTDQFVTMNSPIKVGFQLGFMGLALIQISELRIRLGKALPRYSVAITGLGSFMAMNASLPILLGTGAGILDNTFHMFYAIVLLCGGLYGLFVLFRLTGAQADEPAAADTAETTVAVVSEANSPADTPDTPNAE